METKWNHKILTVQKEDFEPLALEIFNFQYQHNNIYRNYTDALGVKSAAVTRIEEIPFLPVQFFKGTTIQTTSFDPEAIFESSGTTTTINSRHFVKELALYEQSFTKSFELQYGTIEKYCVIGLLPSYLERNNSSLVYMVNHFINKSKHANSGFYLHEFDKLFTMLQELDQQQQPVLLLGVSFALLDFAEKYILPLQHTIIMETGGMKGRREEMIRAALHQKLKEAFAVDKIHAEYGMTELLSQAYSKGDGIFTCPPWMKVLVREEEDPLSVATAGAGLVNIIDLANVYSCSFIATDDVGKVSHDGSFEMLGRRDGSDLRGCSLLVVG